MELSNFISLISPRIKFQDIEMDHSLASPGDLRSPDNGRFQQNPDLVSHTRALSIMRLILRE